MCLLLPCLIHRRRAVPKTLPKAALNQDVVVGRRHVDPSVCHFLLVLDSRDRSYRSHELGKPPDVVSPVAHRNRSVTDEIPRLLVPLRLVPLRFLPTLFYIQPTIWQSKGCPSTTISHTADGDPYRYVGGCRNWHKEVLSQIVNIAAVLYTGKLNLYSHRGTLTKPGQDD